MSDSLLQEQISDYQRLLTATEALLEGDLSEQTVAEHLSLRAELCRCTAARETRLGELMPNLPEQSVTAYRQTLEAVVAAEQRLAAIAAEQRDDLRGQLKDLGVGYRALAGYRQTDRRADARAINHRA